MSELPHRVREVMEPRGAFELAMRKGQTLPGWLGRVCYRKYKRRIKKRSLEIFEEIAQGLGDGDVAIDLGANIGTITARLAATGATVHAFEPDVNNFAILTERFAQAENVHLHQIAVAGYDGEAQLYYPPDYNSPRRRKPAHEAITIMHGGKMKNYIPVETVPVVDFSRILRELPQKPVLVKVDIEGAEWSLLEAVEARAMDRFEYMFVETHELHDHSYLPLARAMQERFAKLDQPYVNLYWW